MKNLNPFEFIGNLTSLLEQKSHTPERLKDNPTLDLLHSRRSVRKFSSTSIPEDVFQAIIEAARLAPSAVNLQTWTFGLFDRESWKEKFDKSIPFEGDRAVIVLGDAHRVRKAIPEFPHKPLVEYTLAVTNASIAAYAMNIAAESCGVGSIMLSETGQTGFYDAEYLKEKLDLPNGVFPVMTVVFGYPKSSPLGMPPKLPLDQITFTDTYRESDEETMQQWLKGMMAGYRATKITGSFKGQLKKYLSKVDEAEEGLRKLIFYKPEEYKNTL
jgi:nitroreductase